MGKEEPKNEGFSKAPGSEKFLVQTMWKHSFLIALALICGYILLVVILTCSIIGDKEKALDALKTITAVFGPWIASLVAFYFAGKQLETVSERLGEAQKLITPRRPPLAGKTVKEIMEPFNPTKHKIPHPELKNGTINSKTPLDEDTIKAIVLHAEEGPGKDVRCFIVFDDKDKVEGIITPADIKNIRDITKTPDLYGKKLLEDVTTDMGRLVKVEPLDTLEKILPCVTTFQVLPVFEGEKPVGFVYRDAVFRLTSSVS